MKNPLRSIEDYELFLYTLKEQFPSICHSTISIIRRGTSLARVMGELYFDHDIRLVVRERLIYQCSSVIIDGYGYEIWRNEDKLCWYDSQPHPGEPSLQSTQPHHKHIFPNIKHNRIPASEMSFTRSNLPSLIQEIETLIKEIENKAIPAGD